MRIVTKNTKGSISTPWLLVSFFFNFIRVYWSTSTSREEKKKRFYPNGVFKKRREVGHLVGHFFSGKKKKENDCEGISPAYTLRDRMISRWGGLPPRSVLLLWWGSAQLKERSPLSLLSMDERSCCAAKQKLIIIKKKSGLEIRGAVLGGAPACVTSKRNLQPFEYSIWLLRYKWTYRIDYTPYIYTSGIGSYVKRKDKKKGASEKKEYQLEIWPALELRHVLYRARRKGQ